MRIAALLLLLTVSPLIGQEFPPAAELADHAGLPDLLRPPDGSPIDSAAEWTARRPRLKALLAYYQYGRMPPKPKDFEISRAAEMEILGGRGVQSLFTLTLRRNGRSAAVRIVTVRPNRPGRFPVVIKNDRFALSLDEIDDAGKRRQYAEQGRDQVDQWVFEEAIDRGYAIVKFNRGDVAPDRRDNRDAGVLALYPEPEYDWGTIAAWAWFYQPLIDHLVRQDWVDSQKLIATGHSRGGKTTLCAGVYEERIAVAAPSASGSGGTGSWRFFSPGGAHEDVEALTSSKPHWFTPRLREFIGREERLPVGSHTAKALIAPRGLLNTLGADDPLSNPVGTRKTFDAAQEVFELLGVAENQATRWRPGGHGQTREDWLALFEFSDRILRGRKSELEFNNWPEVP